MATKQRLGLRQVRALKPGGIMWDPSLPGFGARRQRSEAVSYVLFYRTTEGRQRWFTIGRHGAPWTPESARDEAQRLLRRRCEQGGPRRGEKSGAQRSDRFRACATSTLPTPKPAAW